MSKENTSKAPSLNLDFKTHILFWIGVLFFVSLSVYALKAVLLPFVLGIAVAYLLNPAVNKLGEWGAPRGIASLIILASFLIAFIGALLVTAPILYRELSQLTQDFPQYLQELMALLKPWTSKLETLVGSANTQEIGGLVKENSGVALNVAREFAGRIAQGGMAVVDLLSVLFLMPVVAYFMMKEWTKIVAWVYDLFPRHAEETLMNLLDEINKKISGFVRGQITVAFMLAVIYAIALTIAGLKYGFLIGVIAGAFSIIPMIGSLLGLVISVVVAWFQAGELSYVAIIAGIFLAGQIVEGNFLTPKFVGDSVGLHPLWVFFSILAGGSVLGILGMFLAVPVAAVIGVLIAFALYKYKQSAYYAQPQDDEKSSDAKEN